MKHFFDFNLQLFAEGGAGGGAEGGAAEGSAQADSGVAAPQTNSKNPLAHVQYGKPDSGNTNSEGTHDPEGNAVNTAPNLDAEFKDLVKGKYKEQYGAAVKSAVDARFKSTQETVDRYNKASPLFDMLASKYGTEAGDIDALVKAVEEDDSYYESEAFEKGMSVSQLREVKKFERENAALRAQIEESQQRQAADQIFSKWMGEAENVKTIYPSFDFQSELQNAQFQSLLKSGIPVQTAYEVIHKDEIIPHAMQIAVNETARKITNSIKSGTRRPAEGATGNSSAAVVKTDPSKLTYADRREIERRVARGERIVF